MSEQLWTESLNFSWLSEKFGATIHDTEILKKNGAAAHTAAVCKFRGGNQYWVQCWVKYTKLDKSL